MKLPGLSMRKLIVLFSLSFICGWPVIVSAASNTPTDWQASFAQPPADARILKIIHNWPRFPPGSAADDQPVS